jgi:hypothetical protein
VEDVVATAARLSALISVALGFALVAAMPTGEGSGLAALVGWLGLAMLVVGMLTGIPGSITVAALAFVIQMLIVTGLPVGLAQPLWVHTLLLVLMVEFGNASLSFRDHATDAIVVVGRAVGIGVVAAGLTHLMGLLLAGSEVTGLLLRAAGIGAMVIAGGWVIHRWRRSLERAGSVQGDG